jgi:hypothetical protein
MWCIQTIDAIFRTCMYDVLDLYEEPYDHNKNDKIPTLLAKLEVV